VRLSFPTKVFFVRQVTAADPNSLRKMQSAAIANSGDSRMKKVGWQLRGQGKKQGSNINVKYCWPKVICCMGQSSELEREIKQKTGGASGWARQKSGGPWPPQAPP